MKKDNIINIKVRMNLDREEDRKAWENLRHLDRKKYRSYSRAFIKAMNCLADEEQRAKADPRIERRKEREELLRMITEAVDSSVCNALGPVAAIPLLQKNVTADISDKDREDVSSQEKAALMDEALDFANGF